MSPLDFPSSFKTRTGNGPFPRQGALFGRFNAGDLPEICSIPTGVGKTAVIPIWLMAQAATAASMSCHLVYVVDRRTGVDQATSLVRRGLGVLGCTWAIRGRSAERWPMCGLRQFRATGPNRDNGLADEIRD